MFTCLTFLKLRKLWAEANGTTTTTTHSTTFTSSTSTGSYVEASSVLTEKLFTDYELDWKIVSSTTTTTTPHSSKLDTSVEETLVSDATATTTKTSLIVCLSLATALVCVLVAWAYFKFLKKKNSSALPTVLPRTSNSVIVCQPQVPESIVVHNCESPLPNVPIRTRINILSRHFSPTSLSQTFQRFVLRQQQQQQREEEIIELETIQSVVPTFQMFPGFDLSQFRMIVAALRNPRLSEPNYRLEYDPNRVFHFFPETDCLD